MAGFAWLLKTAAGDEREVAYSLGVPPTGVAASIAPGKRVCQEPIDLPTGAGAVVFPVATDGQAGQPLDVTVRTPSGQVLGHGKIAGGYVDGTEQTAKLDRVAGPAERSAVCIANEGTLPVFIYGSENVTSSHTVADGVVNPVDLDIRFLDDNPRDFAGEIPDAFERAVLFRPGWVGTWVYWLLFALLVIARAAPARLRRVAGGAGRRALPRHGLHPVDAAAAERLRVAGGHALEPGLAQRLDHHAVVALVPAVARQQVAAPAPHDEVVGAVAEVGLAGQRVLARRLDVLRVTHAPPVDDHVGAAPECPEHPHAVAAGRRVGRASAARPGRSRPGARCRSTPADAA